MTVEATECWECNATLSWTGELPEREEDVLCYDCALERVEAERDKLRAEVERLRSAREGLWYALAHEVTSVGGYDAGNVVQFECDRCGARGPDIRYLSHAGDCVLSGWSPASDASPSAPSEGETGRGVETGVAQRAVAAPGRDDEALSPGAPSDAVEHRPFRPEDAGSSPAPRLDSPTGDPVAASPSEATPCDCYDDGAMSVLGPGCRARGAHGSGHNVYESPRPTTATSEAKPDPRDECDCGASVSCHSIVARLEALKGGDFVRVRNGGGRGRVVRGPCFFIQSDQGGPPQAEDFEALAPLAAYDPPRTTEATKKRDAHPAVSDEVLRLLIEDFGRSVAPTFALSMAIELQSRRANERAPRPATPKPGVPPSAHQPCYTKKARQFVEAYCDGSVDLDDEEETHDAICELESMLARAYADGYDRPASPSKGDGK